METGTVIKIILIGDSDVGKTAIVTRFAEDRFSETSMSTVGVEFSTRVIQLDGKIYFLQMWDTAGQERYKSIVKSYFKSAHGVFFVFDLTSKSSLKGLNAWISEVENKGDENIVKMLIGNKKDKENERQIKTIEGLSLAEKLNMDYYETSVLDKVSVDKIFDRMAKLVVKKKTELLLDIPRKNTILGRKDTYKVKKRKNCCKGI